MILIADSWFYQNRLVCRTERHSYQATWNERDQPFLPVGRRNPTEADSFPSASTAGREIQCSLLYGAGCTPEKAPVLRRAIADSLPVIGNIKANSDMLAAAHGLCGQEAGIACILGTGSNSCFYNGKEIVSNISPLGFILGDEGSGAVLGKLLVGDILKNQLPATLKEEFLKQFDLTPPEIIDRVYRQPFPNRFFGQSLSFYRTAFGRTGYPPISYEQLYSFLSQECDAV